MIEKEDLTPLTDPEAERLQAEVQKENGDTIAMIERMVIVINEELRDSRAYKKKVQEAAIDFMQWVKEEPRILKAVGEKLRTLMQAIG